VALHQGIPVVVTSVGGLVEAVAGYEGAVLAPPHDPEALLAAIRKAAALRGRRYAAPHDWRATAARYMTFIAQLRGERDGEHVTAREDS
jgi:glycosyltransferase involved in cell wall biosynthesis